MAEYKVNLYALPSFETQQKQHKRKKTPEKLGHLLWFAIPEFFIFINL